MGIKILLPQDIAQAGKRYLLERGYELKMGRGADSKTLSEDVIGCSGIIARVGNFSREVMLAEPGLQVIARHGVGVDNIDLSAARELGVIVTNDPISNINSVAEHAIALMLCCAKNMAWFDSVTRSGRFALRTSVLNTELKGAILGIIGFGKIGRLIAKKAALGFEMRVIAYDPYITSAEDWVTLVSSLEALLRESDFVSVNMPVTDENRGIIGKKEFALMKSTAYFINAARGELIRQAELIEALQKGEIAGAGLDVYEHEPPETDCPLFFMDNVILSPHNAALTKEAMDNMALIAAKGIDEVLTGKQITFPVVLPEHQRV